MKRVILSALVLSFGTILPLRAAGDRDDLRPLPFHSDEYPKALAEARARAVPLFIESWAPW